MAKGRKNGCPTNIRDWQVSILDQTAGEDQWVRVAGLDTLTRTAASETADGSAGSDLWAEPYVTKRTVTIKLQGKAVGCAASGEIDPGQALLDSYAKTAGCGEDAALRFVDPYGHAMEASFVVTGAEREADGNGSGVSWELKQVGEAEELPYVPVQAVILTPSVLTLRAGDEADVGLAFAPPDASNRRYRIRLDGRQYAAVSQVGEGGFSVRALDAGTARITVTSMNGQKTAQLTVTVEE